VLRDSLGDMNGDTVFEFSHSTTIDVEGSLIGRDYLTISHLAGTTTLSMAQTSILLESEYTGGDFMAVPRGSGAEMYTDVTFETFLPALFEGVRVDPHAINGIDNQPFLTGDGSVRFTVTLQAAVSAFNNTLGYYKVGPDGTISGVDILFANTHAPGSATVDLGKIGDGEQIGFFLIQNGFSQFGALPHNLSFVIQGSTAPADVDGGQPVVLQSATLGALANATIFHSFAALNPGHAEQILSGVAPGGHDLLIGFEDLPTTTGDNDFQDVVINVHTNHDGLLLV
ncbi:MAG TPA: DUF4114 domain-containing protein, partial [Reyranella sp.]|nr:DUF4114 domain-containing protein [Reyranella sp.]